nr:MAG TPA_asm: hypothetical protein [Bacteriophage sp.]
MKLIIMFMLKIQLYKIKHYCLVGSECCEKINFNCCANGKHASNFNCYISIFL